MDRNMQIIKDKTDDLNRQAWEIRVSDSNKALLLSEEAIGLAKKIGYTKGIAEGLRTLGFSHLRLSNHAEANRHLEEALKLFELLNDQCGQSDVYEYLGIIQRSFGNYQASLELLFKALEMQKATLEQTVDELKSTQIQLIQSEKMALLGELTAGIAHEIQNPLNFVNNFSEVNAELIDEMKNELTAGNSKEAASIAGYIKENQEKITHHGKRADSIVKGMLQHSRNSTGQKEPTDINALADEYLRLSYHGLRAKDKTFNASMQTDFDASIEKINIIPQDIGRVLLNLFTNAFYAVTEKKKQQPEDFEPSVSVSTIKHSFTVEIRVKDNGTGIPQQVMDKIFQPFFTTKPTGQGTGLGLSLSYDIIKAHGGEFKVETKEGEVAEFIIHLPIDP